MLSCSPDQSLKLLKLEINFKIKITAPFKQLLNLYAYVIHFQVLCTFSQYHDFSREGPDYFSINFERLLHIENDKLLISA